MGATNPSGLRVLTEHAGENLDELKLAVGAVLDTMEGHVANENLFEWNEILSCRRPSNTESAAFKFVLLVEWSQLSHES